jgi:thiol-disulfide isomerase/thioredoxin
MKPSRRHILIVAATLLAAITGYFAIQNRKQERLPASTPAVSPVDAAEATAKLLSLTLPDAKGASQSLRQWQGKILVVNFWATWCSPCRKEIPGFSRLQQKYADKSVQFVGIAFDSADKIDEFSKHTAIAYPTLIASQTLAPITVGLGNAANGLPFTAIIGRDGRLFQSRLGVWQETELEAILADLTR